MNDLLKRKRKAEKMVEKWSTVVDEINREILNSCTHTHTEIVNYNVEGGYLNVAEYHKIKKCITCKKELDRKIEYGSYA